MQDLRRALEDYQRALESHARAVESEKEIKETAQHGEPAIQPLSMRMERVGLAVKR